MTNTELNGILAANKKVMVKLSAPWCGPCRALAPVVEKIAEERTDVRFVEVDVEGSPEVASEYGITSVPTILFFKNGEAFDMTVGMVTSDRITGILDRMDE